MKIFRFKLCQPGVNNQIMGGKKKVDCVYLHLFLNSLGSSFILSSAQAQAQA